MGPTVTEAMAETEALLFGRRTWQTLMSPAAGSPPVPGRRPLRRPDERDPQVRGVPTLTRDDLHWPGSALLPADDVIGAVRELRAREGRAIQVMGSATLAAQLIEHDLVDEYRLMLEPILLGGGKRVFPCDGRARALELVSATTTGTGVLICTYRRR